MRSLPRAMGRPLAQAAVGAGELPWEAHDPQGFNPRMIPNLSLHLDAGLGITLVSDVVSNWADQSGLGNHAAQTTAGSRPAYSAADANFAGHASLNFVATRFLTIPHAATLNMSSAGVTCYIVSRSDASAPGNALMLDKRTGDIEWSFVTDEDGLLVVAAQIRNAANTAWVRAGGPNIKDNVVRILRFRSSNTDVGMRANLAAETTTALANFRTGTANVGVNGTATGGAGFTWDCAAILFYNRFLNGDEDQRITRHLSWKYRVPV